MKQMKLKQKLIVFFVLTALSTSILGYLFVQFSRSQYNDVIYRESSEKFHLFSLRIEEKLQNIDLLSLSILSDPFIQSYLLTIKERPNTFEAYQAANNLKRKLLSYQLFDYAVASIVIIDSNGAYHGAGVHAASLSKDNVQSAVDTAAAYKGASVWVSGDQDGYFQSLREIREVSDYSMEPIGTMILRAKADSIVYSSSEEKEYYDSAIIIAAEGRAMFSSPNAVPLNELEQHLQDNGSYSVIALEGNKYLAARFKLDYTGWTFIQLVPYGFLFLEIEKMQAVLLVLYAVLLIIVLTVGVRLSSHITKPIGKLMSKMAVVEKGNLELDRLEIPNQRNEITLLSLSFDRMIDRLNELIKENYIKQLMLRNAEYDRLKAQINPHFLYNTLESINWLARMNGQLQISGMVKALGKLLRSSITESPYTTIQEEIDNLNHYIYIQKFRFEDRLDYRMEIGEHLRHLYISSFILQPIVENSIKYAVEPSAEPCHIVITAEEHPHRNRFDIIVSDSGGGMDPLYLQKLERDEISAEGTGVGLKSIHNRLRLLHGPEYGLTIENESGQGTVIRIALPYIHTPELSQPLEMTMRGESIG
ncbi:cache domain-containing sensor histidine kinase [Paenibacillus sp. YIM B09110]|uniref:cache domain-containing sensor histidine kinase n=1 Tax=Paenibacillus sp. YIM B09110 TaxID=3126102 RepID=UPI00301C5CB2